MEKGPQDAENQIKTRHLSPLIKKLPQSVKSLKKKRTQFRQKMRNLKKFGNSDPTAI